MHSGTLLFDLVIRSLTSFNFAVFVAASKFRPTNSTTCIDIFAPANENKRLNLSYVTLDFIYLLASSITANQRLCAILGSHPNADRIFSYVLYSPPPWCDLFSRVHHRCSRIRWSALGGHTQPCTCLLWKTLKENSAVITSLGKKCL